MRSGIERESAEPELSRDEAAALLAERTDGFEDVRSVDRLLVEGTRAGSRKGFAETPTERSSWRSDTIPFRRVYGDCSPGDIDRPERRETGSTRGDFWTSSP